MYIMHMDMNDMNTQEARRDHYHDEMIEDMLYYL